MATGVITLPSITKTVTIDTDLSAAAGLAVTFDGSDDGVVNLLAAATSVPFVLYSGGNGATTATTGTIVVSGGAEVTIGGTVAAGDKLTATTAGKFIATTTDADNYGAIALIAGVANDKISVLVVQGMIAA